MVNYCIIAKFIFRYQIEAEGRPGRPVHTFQKPWFSNLMMFIGMFVLFVIYLVFYLFYFIDKKNN